MVTSARRWNSYVCPGCRFVFRVPQDHDGTGVVCPACRVMLRLPGEGENPPLLIAAAPADTAEEEEFEEHYDDEEIAAAAKSDRTFLTVMILGGLALLIVVSYFMIPRESSATPVAQAPAPAPPVVPAARQVDEPKPLMVDIESTVKAFLEAPTREAALERVLAPEETARKWAAWDGDDSYRAPGFRGLIGDPVTIGEGADAVTYIQVRTADFELREIAMIRDDGRLKVDWESWAGWCEMKWEDFMTEKPTEPVLFRVVVSPADYYNFNFRDDREWTSYRLESSDVEEYVYGYVPRTSDIDQQLRPTDPGAKSRWLLKLKFPAGATQPDQVLIDSIVASTWVKGSTPGK